MSIKYRLELNLLTTPHSYRIQVVPGKTVGYDEMAADISAAHPNFTEEMVRSLGPLIMEWIQQQMINGDKVIFPKAISFFLSCFGKIDNPDDQFINGEESMQMNMRVSKPYMNKIRTNGKLERQPMSEKLPVISFTEDRKLKLADVLNPAGVLRITGNNMDFDEDNPNCGCIIEGTRNGQTKQSTYGIVDNSQILLVPNIPAQDAPWNNEYMVTITTQYSEHGSLRSGIYRRKLRTPLTWDGLPHEGGIGILTGSAEVPYVTIESGTVAADEMLRIQAMIDSRTGTLLMHLIDMQEGGRTGATVAIPANGDYVLPGFSGSNVSNVHITVHEWTALIALMRNSYSNRLVDIVDIRLT
jgi:hypothetical protein